MKNISYLLLAFLVHYSQAVFANPVDSAPLNTIEIYDVLSDVVLNAKMSGASKSTSITSLQIKSPSHVVVLDKTKDANNEEWIRIGIEDANSENLERADYWVLASEFLSLPLARSEDPVLRMTYCYRYVKMYLLDHGLVDEYLPGASAYMAASILPKYGFDYSGRSPSQAIVHDVCVYKGGPSGHGHIEIMTPSGWYYGYGYKSQPIKNRVLISCFHK